MTKINNREEMLQNVHCFGQTFWFHLSYLQIYKHYTNMLHDTFR